MKQASQRDIISVNRSDLQDIKCLVDEVITGLHYIESTLYSAEKCNNTELMARVAGLIMGSALWQSQTANNISCYLEEMLKNNQ